MFLILYWTILVISNMSDIFKIKKYSYTVNNVCQVECNFPYTIDKYSKIEKVKKQNKKSKEIKTTVLLSPVPTRQPKFLKSISKPLAKP